MLELECECGFVGDMYEIGMDGSLTEFQCPECGCSNWERIID